MDLNWERTAKLNNMTVEKLRIYFNRFPTSNKGVVRICPDCLKEEEVSFFHSGDRCNRCGQMGRIIPEEVKKKQCLSNLGKHDNDPHHVWTNEEKEEARIRANIQWDNPELLEIWRQNNLGNTYSPIGKDNPQWKERVELICDTCGKTVLKLPVDVRNHNFCDQKCFIEYEGFNISNTKIEVLIQNILSKMDIKFETQVHILSYYPDILLTDYNIIIECDGDWWHGNEKVLKKLEDWHLKVKEKDRIRNKKLTMEGYTVLRFWEDDIINNIENCKQILKSTIKLEENKNDR